MKIATIILNILFALAFVPSVGLLLPTMMMFDAPGSTKSPYTIFTAASIVAIPIVIVIAQFVSWIALARGNLSLALWGSLMPLVPSLLAVLGFVLIQVFQGGKFTP